jgi:hypothetical protein
MLIVISAIRMNRVLPEWSTRPVVKLLTISGVLQLGDSLAVHSMAWRVSVLEEAAGQPFDLARVDSYFNIVPQPDPFYVALVNVSAVVTLLGLLILFGGWIRSAKR